MNESPYVVTITTQNFVEAVIEKSKEVPVLVDFWAEWCSPCKTLMPTLYKLADAYQGNFILAKINIDEQPELATQYSVRSVPTLKLFKNSNIVDELLGVQPESALRTLIERHRERPADRLRQQANIAYKQGNIKAAIEILQTARAEEPDYYPLHLDLANYFISDKQFDDAERVLQALPVNIQADPIFNQLSNKLNFARIALTAPTIDHLDTQIAQHPDDIQAYYQRGAYAVLIGEYEKALADFLVVMRLNRRFQEDAGRKGILAVFNLLNNQGDLVSQYRSKMSALLY
ncbi:thioredoxin [Beggiatoa leptomitoformis]|uniref:Thioredoxin n=1 Tax=Beggiatoa leptomitoformis TaxID=288004 RepID=A0A2N9YH76_9GAMM|nr:thioredoxin [Beggiatoa leptomitoformis]ALG67975.1 thioredoxin [Beggiatoa leptomitoformis]AUI69745.1 thioredoxin [Beggiatoa leptomitoformis]